MSRWARFEVVRTDAGWHARFRAANGRMVWTTEVYTRRTEAFRAIYLVSQSRPYDVQGDWFISSRHGVREVRVIDERGRTEDGAS